MEPEKRSELAEGENAANPVARTTEVQVNICLGSDAMTTLKGYLLVDREYHLGWHSNLACAAMDAFAGACLPFGIRWQRSQEAARRFIDMMFAGGKLRPLPITNEEVRSGPDPQDDPIESKAWLTKIIASIEEAGKHEGPLDGRKLLGDLEKAVTLVMLGRLVPAAEAKARALLEAKLERKHVEIGSVAGKLRMAESANVERRAEFESLQEELRLLHVELAETQNAKARACSQLTLQNRDQLEENEPAEQHLLINDDGQYFFGGADQWYLRSTNSFKYSKERATELAERKKVRTISKSDAEKRDRDDTWLIRSASTGRWYKGPGDGTTPSVAKAHRYTWIKAIDTHKRISDTLHHISDPDVKDAK